MAVIQCHQCKAEVSTEASACPGCGANPYGGRKPHRFSIQLRGIAVIGVIILIIGILLRDVGGLTYGLYLGFALSGWSLGLAMAGTWADQDEAKRAMERESKPKESRQSLQPFSNGAVFIHRSMLMAIEAIDQSDLALARRHVQLGIERWEAEKLPLYGQEKPSATNI